MGRCFLVARYQDRIVIREVRPGSCAFTHTRESSFAMAKRLAAPAKRSWNKRKAATSAVFIDLDLHSHDIPVP